jgi:protein phosphatase
MHGAVTTDSFGLTDVGRERRANEDQFLVAGLNKGMLVQQTSLPMDDQTQLMSGAQGKVLAVADGMGGHVAGDRASALAIRAITRYLLNTMPWFFRLDGKLEDDLREELAGALERARDEVQQDATRHGLKGMGTTLTMAYVLWPRLYVVHAGDSRCYLLRDGELRQLTTDHSMAQQLVDQGAMGQQEADDSQWTHVLYNAIVADGSSELSPEVYKARLRGGDTLLLCTDGLTKHVPEERIVELLNGQAEQAAHRLIDAANDDGGSDNTTVVVARFGPTTG